MDGKAEEKQSRPPSHAAGGMPEGASTSKKKNGLAVS